MNLIHRLLTDAPLVSDGALAALLDLSNRPIDPRLAEDAWARKMRENMKPKVEMRGNLAIVPIQGMLARRPDVFEMLFYGMEDSQSVLDTFNQAASDKSVAGILADIDSPGGFYTGGPEIGDAIKNCKKPVVAWTGGMCCSLAYLFASQAPTLIASRSAQVGSIGAYTTLVDYSRMLANAGISVEVIKNKEADFKAIGAQGTSVTDTQRSHLQAQIQSVFDEFKSLVTTARPGISEDSMRGQVFSGTQAEKLGLIDFVGSRDAALALLEKRTK